MTIVFICEPHQGEVRTYFGRTVEQRLPGIKYWATFRMQSSGHNIGKISIIPYENHDEQLF